MLPSIIFQTQYCKYYPKDYIAKNPQEQARIDKSNNFYRCNSQYNICSYLNDHGTDNIPLDEVKKLESILDENGKLQNIDKNYINYLENRGGSTGLFDKDGDVSKEKFKEYTEKLKTTHSTIWSGVVSFTPEYSSQYVNNKEQAYKTIKNTIDKFFLEAGFKPENMEWTGVYHTNTDNRHIHLLWWEKEPIKVASDGSKKWHNFKLSKDAINNYKYLIADYHQATDYSYFQLREEARNELKSIFQNTEHIDFIKNLNINLGKLTSKQYARQNNKTKDILQTALRTLIEMDKSHEEINQETGEIIQHKGLREITKEYFDALHNTQSQIINNYTEVNVPMPKSASEFASSRIDEYYNRMCNEILKGIFEYRQNEKNLAAKDEVNESLAERLKYLQSLDLKLDLKSNSEAYKSICFKGYKHNHKQQELKDKLITTKFETKEEREEAFLQAYDIINLKDYPSLEDDRAILNKYGLDFVVNRTNEIPFKSNTQSGIIKGDYNQYTFINKEGYYETYNLNLNPSIQPKGIAQVFKKLGLDDNKIINLCDELNQDGLAFNLITKTGNYNLDAIGNSSIKGIKVYDNKDNPEKIRKQANLFESNNKKAGRIFGDILGALGGEQNDMLEELARFEKYWKEKHSKEELLNEKGEPEEIDSLLNKKKKKKSQMEMA